jgi:SNF2 family DNA or RNA helicase
MRIHLNEDQQNALEIIKDKKQFGIFFDMGVGKTALMLALIEYLAFDKLEIQNILIVAPASVANRLNVWQDEIKKWENFDYFDFQDLSGTAKQRIEKIDTNKSSITIISDSLMEWWYEKYGTLNMFDMIIVDESSRFKSSKSIRFKRLARMIDINTQRVYLLSGTPVPNGWEDIWSQIFLLDKGQRLGTSFWRFLETNFLIYNYRKILPKQNKEEILRKINDICMFASSDKIKLPKKTETKIYFNFSQEKKETFDAFEKNYIMDLDGNEISVLSKQILINKCLQLSNGCIYHDKAGNYTFFDDSKLRFVEQYSKENPSENILVFYAFKFDKERLLKIEGAKAIENTNDKDDWNNGKIKIGIISPYSFQYGGNLQYGGNVIIWFGLLWGLENYLQSNKRIWRQGQTKDVKIFYLMMQDTWDDYVYKAVVTKEIDQKDFLDRIDIRKREFAK